MKPLLYIHVGFPKTGTTTIQKFCLDNRDHLKKKDIYYPVPLGTPEFNGHIGHLDISENAEGIFQSSVSWKKCLDRYFEDMIHAKCSTNILSAEALVGDNPKNLDILNNEFDVRIVCFFRNFFGFLSSHEKQIVKLGLRNDVFLNLKHRNHSILFSIEKYVDFFGLDKCIFLNYDNIAKEGNILDSFFHSLDVDIDISKYSITKENITPSDVATMFFYQLSFLPLVRWEWNILRKEILSMNFSQWRSYRCTLLPSFVFTLDNEAKRSIRRQGELLNDPNWYDYTISRGEEMAKITNHDLPSEVQCEIWEKFSDSARAIIRRHCPKVEQAMSKVPFLPSLERIPPDVFEQMAILRRGYTTCLCNLTMKQSKIDSLEKEFARERERESAKERARESERQRLRVSAQDVKEQLLVNSRYARFRIWDCLSPLFSTTARQVYSIRKSGLFDVKWYIERYPEIAWSGIDPVLHYVRYGAGEGRDPAPWFSTSAYVQANPDVASSSINPLYHYIRFGVAEGRVTFDAR